MLKTFQGRGVSLVPDWKKVLNGPVYAHACALVDYSIINGAVVPMARPY
jgi:hypothetical protein